MTARAFIIAIEKYGALPNLPGVNADAQKFYDWLVKTKKVKANSIFACADKKKCPWATTGTKADDITFELNRLWEKVWAWANAGDTTDELFFYYSGHGFANTKTNNEKPVDHLVASDFKNKVLSGNKCLEFYQIKERLYRSLGPQIAYYYFIDACRNTDNDVAPTGLSFNPDVALNGADGPIFWLFSTAEKELAARDSGFAKALVQGLKGEGSAAGWYRTKYWVQFPNLVDYIDTKIQETNPQKADSDQDGKGAGLILKVDPVPQYQGQVIIDNAKPTDEFSLSIVVEGGSPEQIKFKGRSHTFKRLPGNLEIGIQHPTAKVVQKDPPPSDEGVRFFEDLKIRFEKQADATFSAQPARSARSLRLRGAHAARPADVQLAGLPSDEIHFENLKTGSVRTMSGNFTSKVAPGDYLIKIRQQGLTIGKKRVNLQRGAHLSLNLRDPKAKLIPTEPSSIRDQCASVIAQHEDPPLKALSTSLGPLATWDLSLLLSLLGAARIVYSANDFPKLSKLPLADFGGAQRNDSPVYVLGGFEKTKGNVEVGLSDGAKVAWKKLAKVASLGIHQQVITANTGPHLFSIKIPKQPAITYATHCLPNRATLIVLAENIKGRLTFHQYILPIRVLFGFLDYQVLQYLNSNPLNVVRLMFLAQSQFGRKRAIFDKDGGPVKDFELLLEGKWLDPIMSLIGAYEAIRGGILKKKPHALDIMLRNLRRFFGGLPDTEAIAKTIRDPSWVMPKGAPLLLESVLAFDRAQEERILPLPSHQVDYGSSWTSWRGMVK